MKQVTNELEVAKREKANAWKLKREFETKVKDLEDANLRLKKTFESEEISNTFNEGKVAELRKELQELKEDLR